MPGVELFPYATGNMDGSVFFESSEESSGVTKVSETGSMEVQMRKLDTVLKGRKVSFLKMDIEGAELETLKGARMLISEQKPTLAICIYHSDNDMLEILPFLHELVPDYKFYIRHYSYGVFETVLYAVI